MLACTIALLAWLLHSTSGLIKLRLKDCKPPLLMLSMRPGAEDGMVQEAIAACRAEQDPETRIALQPKLNLGLQGPQLQDRKVLALYAMPQRMRKPILVQCLL